MAQTPKTQSWQRWLLVGSLALNLLVLGAIGGAVLKGGPSGPGNRIDLTTGPLTRAMTSEDRSAIRDVLRASRAFGPQDRAAIREDMQSLLALLAADPFDAEAFRAVLDRQRSRLTAGQDAALDALTAQIETMTPQARAEFAERLQDQLRRGPSSRDGRDGRDGSGG